MADEISIKSIEMSDGLRRDEIFVFLVVWRIFAGERQIHAQVIVKGDYIRLLYTRFDSHGKSRGERRNEIFIEIFTVPSVVILQRPSSGPREIPDSSLFANHSPPLIESILFDAESHFVTTFRNGVDRRLT